MAFFLFGPQKPSSYFTSLPIRKFAAVDNYELRPLIIELLTYVDNGHSNVLSCMTYSVNVVHHPHHKGLWMTTRISTDLCVTLTTLSTP